MNDKELRFNTVECRAEGEELILEGYPIVWDVETLIGSKDYGFYESIDRHALDNANIKDVPLKYNHMDNTYILARTRNKSLTLKEDDKGLFMRAILQKDVHAHIDVYNMVRSGLLDKMSFAFNVIKQDVKGGDIPVRKVKSIGKLFDVSIVNTPAYEQTSVFARSFDLLDNELKALDNEVKKQDCLQVEKLKYQYLLGGKL